MASDMFLVLDGIPGESQDKQFPKTIDIGSVTYGMSVPGSPTEPISGKPSVDQIVVSKLVDSASLHLLRALAETRRVDNGRISIRRPSTTTTGAPVVFLMIDLGGVYVRGVEVENQNDYERPSERVTLAFERIVWTYTPVSPTGTLGTKITYEYTVDSRTIA
jgi:type VI secretion system secreted protein Hcp